MKYTTYYLIRPTKLLNESLKIQSPDIQDLLSRPVLWTKKEGGITSWTLNEYLIQVKLVFLLNLRMDYVVDNEDHPELQQLIEKILGSPPYTTEVFDRWWTIEHLEEDEQYESVEERLGIDNLTLIAPTKHPLIDDWLSYLKKKNK